MNYKDPLKMIDPITGMETTLQPPVPANERGGAKPLFGETAQNLAGQIYGDVNTRQMSLGNNAPTFMTEKQENAFGPSSEVYKDGNTAIYEGIKEDSK